MLSTSAALIPSWDALAAAVYPAFLHPITARSRLLLVADRPSRVPAQRLHPSSPWLIFWPEGR